MKADYFQYMENKSQRYSSGQESDYGKSDGCQK